MKKQTIAIFLVLVVAGLFSVSASAQSTHSVWTNNNGLVVRDPTNGCNYASLTRFDMATSWTEPTPGYPAQAHFRGITRTLFTSVACSASSFEFTLLRSSATTSDDITGRWNVYRNGVLVCSSCAGVAYGLSSPAGVGNYYKVYVDDPAYPGTEDWLYSGYIDVRKDF